MFNQYIKEKKSVGKRILNNLKLLVGYWQITVSAATLILLGLWIWNHASDSMLLQIVSAVVNAASILAAVLITFLVAKVIQLRQEKISVWSEYHQLTQKLHHFRGAIYPLYTNYEFWPSGLKYDMEHKYKELSQYEVRKGVFVHGTQLSPLAQEFSRNTGGVHSLYLELRSFLTGKVPHDITMFKGDFDDYNYYDHEQLELWLTFNCGNGLFYYFNHKYAIYKDSFHFHKISTHDQESVKDNCIRIDARRYKNIPFGPMLYDLLGQQFTSELLPKLILASRTVNGTLPGPVNLLSNLLTLLIPLGILIPFLVLLELLPIRWAAISVAGTVALLVYIMTSFNQILIREIKIKHP